MADSYEDFLRDDAAYERALDRREALEREDIMDIAAAPLDEWEAA